MPKMLVFCCMFVVLSSSASGADPVFKRGDANNDGAVDGSDVSYINDYLFNGGDPPPCMDAADVNDDGSVDISDSSSLVDYLFNGGQAPPAPFPDCGSDPTSDGLSCDISTCS